MRVLVIGDIFGRPGRRVVSNLLPKIRAEILPDFVIANGENIAGGLGITVKTFEKLLSYGIDCVTSGTHVWDKDEIYTLLENFPDKVLRPLNYSYVPGRGYSIFPNGVAVINLLGRLFMPHPLVKCPFETALRCVKLVRSQTKVIIVDFHAESPMEKLALGVFLNGRVSAVVGTHTHVQTADETILSHGTAYITDIGMTGSFNSVIGVKHENSIGVFLKATPHRFDCGKGDNKLNAVIIDIDNSTGKAYSIRRLVMNAS